MITDHSSLVWLLQLFVHYFAKEQ